MDSSTLGEWMGNNALAIYAAALSTLLAAVNSRSSRPRMQVVMVHGTKGQDHGFYVQILNPSAHPVHAHHVWLLYQYKPYRLRDFVEDVVRFRAWSPSWGWCHSDAPIEEGHGLPVTIAPYTAHRVFIPIDKLRMMFLDADVTPALYPAGTGIRPSSNAPDGRPSSSSFCVHRAA